MDNFHLIYYDLKMISTKKFIILNFELKSENKKNK